MDVPGVWSALESTWSLPGVGELTSKNTRRLFHTQGIHH